MNHTHLYAHPGHALGRTAFAVALLGAAMTSAFASSGHHHLYTMTNAHGDNRVVVLEQRFNGTLDYAGSVSTHGTGLGTNLGSQGALAESAGGRWLFAVNAGSNQITTFSKEDGELRFVSLTPSGGMQPVSVTTYGNMLYVLNAGGNGNITGFRITHDGKLKPIPGSTRGLGGNATGPAQVKFSNGGEFLVVSEKAANQIAVFEVEDGAAQVPTVSPSVGKTPFGFEIGPRDQIVVSEAATGTVSSYRLSDASDKLLPITSALQTNQLAPCWIALTPNGRYAYSANAASGTITAFRVQRDGHLSRLPGSGVSASTGATSHTIDLTTSGDGRFLYALANVGQTVSAFRIGANGSLTSTGQFTGVPTSSVGLVAD